MTDDAVEILWKRVVDDWDNESAHGAFLEHCQIEDKLLEAAVRYRGMCGDRDRAESAKKRLEAVSILAMSKLESHRTPPPTSIQAAVGVALVVLFSAGSAFLLWALGR